MYHVPKLIEEREMEDLLERLVEKQAEINMLTKEKREMVSVEKVVTELLKQVNWDRQFIDEKDFRGSTEEIRQDAKFEAIRAIGDISGKDFRIINKELTSISGKKIKEFSFDDNIPMLEPKF